MCFRKSRFYFHIVEYALDDNDILFLELIFKGIGEIIVGD